jgi:AdoMet-dependent heme synthase
MRHLDVLTPFLPAAPYHMVWLATNACNARCVHCSSDALKCRPSELTTREATRMLEELQDLGVFDVAVSGGEPLVRPDLFEVLGHARALGLRLGIGSNGSTITPEVLRRLVDLGVDRVQISIDGVEQTHDRARRWVGLYRRAVRAIESAVDAGLRVHVCFTAHRMNHRELSDVVASAAGWGVRRFNLSRFVPTGRGDASLDLEPTEWKALVEDLERLRRQYAGVLDFSTHLAQLILVDPGLDCVPGFVGCQAGAGQGCIGPEGEVMPCVMLPLVAGNIRDRPLREIWETSDVMVSLRDRSRLKGRCLECLERDRCGGCRGVAYAYTGDHLASDPRCWKS